MKLDDSLKVEIEELGDNLWSVADKTKVDEKWETSLLTETEARKVFFEYKKESRAFNYTQLLCRSDKSDGEIGFIIQNGKFLSIKELMALRKGGHSSTSSYASLTSLILKQAVRRSGILDNVSSVRVPKGFRFDGKRYTKFQILLEIGGIPTALKSKKLFKNLLDLINHNYVVVNREGIKITREGLAAIEAGKCRMNQKLMMEKMRPFWERSDGNGENTVDINDFNEFQIGLFNVDGLLKSNLAFEVDIEKLNHILQNRIEKGVKQFIEALKDTFTSKHIGKTGNADKINIFLAGNSSKSPILKDVFQKNIAEWNKGIKGSENGKNDDDADHFTLFPPLGTDEAISIQEERGVLGDDYLESPTGKTGVAWGLIEGREGGRIEVVEEVAFDSETKFSYYLGIQKGKNFFMKVHRDEAYTKWNRFLLAKRKINEILFTSLPEATSGSLSCSETGVFRKRIEIPYVSDEEYLYIRFVSTNGIEYAIGDAEGNIDETSIKQEML